uniref:Uncharacterized protein n=1 Tax=Anopheles atroparvus TaxID=41427 RepID=A0AAG5D4V0_ANOAO
MLNRFESSAILSSCVKLTKSSSTYSSTGTIRSCLNESCSKPNRIISSRVTFSCVPVYITRTRDPRRTIFVEPNDARNLCRT